MNFADPPYLLLDFLVFSIIPAGKFSELGEFKGDIFSEKDQKRKMSPFIQ